MPISDPRYLVFLAITVALFHLLPPGPSRRWLLLLASYLYYLTFPPLFSVLLLGITFFAYGAGLAIQKTRDTSFFYAVVTCSLMFCASPMLILKYFWLPEALAKTNWIYPVGLSFYTFVALAYLIDIALDVFDAETEPLNIALACGFFPTVTLGPLLRTTFFPQLQFQQPLSRERLTSGATSILLGATLKLWVADTLAVSVDAIYSNITSSPPLERLVGSAVEAYQVYADWLGYSLIAIGSAKLFGVDFPDNFRQPYLSTNISEFWRSWNVSLINWFRDYIFAPIRVQFQAKSSLAVPVATLVTFSLLGAWHAKGWTYLAYGVVNGLLVIYSQLTLEKRSRFWNAIAVPGSILNPLRILSTFFVVVLTVPLARALNLNDAAEIYRSFLSWSMLENVRTVVHGEKFEAVFPHTDFKTVLPLIGLIVLADILAVLRRKHRMFPLPRLLKIPLYVACVLGIAGQVALLDSTKPFVYFRY